MAVEGVTVTDASSPIPLLFDSKRSFLILLWKQSIFSLLTTFADADADVVAAVAVSSLEVAMVGSLSKEFSFATKSIH